MLPLDVVTASGRWSIPGVDAGVFPILISLLLAYTACTVTYSLFISPLAGIPGPWYAAVSDVWLLLHAARLERCRTIQTLFERYGPIVRVGPRRVAFCDRDALKRVYCIDKLGKSTFYKMLLVYVLVIFDPHSLH